LYKHTASTTYKRLIGHATNVLIACHIIIMSSSALGTWICLAPQQYLH